MKKKKLSKEWTTVTTLSKTIALILFIGLPFLGFYLGIEYQKRISPQLIQVNETNLNNIPTPTISPATKY